MTVPSAEMALQVVTGRRSEGHDADNVGHVEEYNGEDGGIIGMMGNPYEATQERGG